MNCKTHNGHDHKHGDGCGHTTIQHEGHTDYLHDNHMHHVHGDHIDEHNVGVGSANQASCTTGHECSTHDAGHKHGQDCGHSPVPHGDHTDYLVGGHLHNHHDGHCDDHGKVASK